MARRSGFLEALAAEHRVVGWHWRLLGAALAISIMALLMVSFDARSLAFRYNTSLLIDNWQRLSGPDKSSGDVVVVGVDRLAISRHGRWPWSRLDLAKLVKTIALQDPRSISLDFLLTEPGPYSFKGLSRVFRENTDVAAEQIVLDPDEQLAATLGIAPTVLAIAGGSRANFDLDEEQVFCADPGYFESRTPPGYVVECLFLPYEPFQTSSVLATTRADDDIDGIVRRGRALIGFPAQDPQTPGELNFFPAFPLAALTACSGVKPECPALDIQPEDLTSAGANEWSNFSLRFTSAAGDPPPPLSVTENFGIWLDFGALKPDAAWEACKAEGDPLDAMGEPGCEQPPLYEVLSAADVMLGRPEALSRLKDKYVVIGLTRLGDVDQHATPLSNESGTPGVLIQALAADNVLTGKALAQYGWTAVAGRGFMALMALMALARFLFRDVYWLTTLIAACVAAPVVASYAVFEFGGAIVYGLAPAAAALLAGAPIFFGRIAAVLRAWLADRDEKNRQNERLRILNKMQEGALPFDVNFSEMGVDSAAICRPSLQVGGDFFEKVELPDGRLFGAVGDVMGKDVNAMVVMVNSRVISGVVAKLYDMSMGDIFREISDHFLRCAPTYWIEEQGGFATLVAARLDPRTGVAEFATAGADIPIVVTAKGEIREIDLPSVAPLGWLAAPTFKTAELTLEPGDSIVMFTDGVTEAPAPSDDNAPPSEGIEFGYARARAAVQDAASMDSAGILAALDARVAAHLAGGEPIDDTTILVMTYNGPPGSGER